MNDWTITDTPQKMLCIFIIINIFPSFYPLHPTKTCQECKTALTSQIWTFKFVTVLVLSWSMVMVMVKIKTKKTKQFFEDIYFIQSIFVRTKAELMICCLFPPPTPHQHSYSWVNENWDFLAENYVFLEYFLTRNM